ncbi:MAG: PIN domain-containing protein [Xanthobacteraceae bacterium]
METAVLDACVLFRGGVRDFLLWVAEAGAFSPAWSDAIHDEWMSNRRAKLGDPASRLEYARSQMEQAFPGANFEPDTIASKTISLPDANDVHVVATAIAAHAQTIITYNLAHFPDSALSPLRLRAEAPDAFCSRLFTADAETVIEGARLHRQSLKRPAYDVEAYLEHLALQDLKATSDLLRKSYDRI